jgi:hypothetical protein
MLRTEEWTHEYTLPEPEEVERDTGEGVIQPEFHQTTLLSTLVISVWEGEVVRVSRETAKEFRMDPAQSKEVVPEGQQRFVWEFPYDVMRQTLEAEGWERASTTEA